MKVSLVNMYDLDGGAARAAHRLHGGLQEIGVASTYYVNKKSSDESTIIGPTTKISRAIASIRPSLNAFPLSLYSQREPSTFSTGLFSDTRLIKLLNKSDVVNLHWFSSGLLSIEAISKINRPVVFSLHDSWLLTGGCHVPGKCERFFDSCGECPQLKSSHAFDLSRIVWLRKKRAWGGKQFTLVTDGRWLADNARKSPLFEGCNIETINPGLDLNRFKPLDKQVCRDVLGLPSNCSLVLFGAMSATVDKNKGYQLLLPALNHLSTEGHSSSIRLLVFGASKSTGLTELNIPVHFTGRLHDDISLSILYSAADVMVVPSIQECFGQTASESMACGTPVVAFDTTGLKDSVDHEINGYLAKPFDITDLANGIKWVLENKDRWNKLSRNAREKAVKCFSISTYTNNYLNVFQKTIDNFNNSKSIN